MIPKKRQIALAFAKNDGNFASFFRNALSKEGFKTVTASSPEELYPLAQESLLTLVFITGNYYSDDDWSLASALVLDDGYALIFVYSGTMEFRYQDNLGYFSSSGETDISFAKAIGAAFDALLTLESSGKTMAEAGKGFASLRAKKENTPIGKALERLKHWDIDMFHDVWPTLCSAKEGDDEALYWRGYCHLHGFETEKNIDKAIADFESSSFPMAQVTLRVLKRFGLYKKTRLPRLGKALEETVSIEEAKALINGTYGPVQLDDAYTTLAYFRSPRVNLAVEALFFLGLDHYDYVAFDALPPLRKEREEKIYHLDRYGGTSSSARNKVLETIARPERTYARLKGRDGAAMTALLLALRSGRGIKEEWIRARDAFDPNDVKTPLEHYVAGMFRYLGLVDGDPLPYFEAASASGIGRASSMTGILHYERHAYRLAKDFFKVAKFQGDPLRFYGLGISEASLGHHHTAANYFLEAEKRGIGGARVKAGLALLSSSKRNDLFRAEEYLSLSHDIYPYDSYAELAVAYLKKDVFSSKKNLAKRLLLSGVEKGNPKAMRWLGICYFERTFFALNRKKKAKRLWLLAVEKGDEESAEYLETKLGIHR